MSSPYWNPQQPDRGGQPPQPGGWSYGPPPPGHGTPRMPGQGVPGQDVPGQGARQDPELRTAGFGPRLAARAIDYVLAVIAATAFFVVMVILQMILTGNDTSNDAEGALWGSLFLFGWGVLLFFYDWLYLITWGRTLGKMMVGIKVVSAVDGGRLTQGQAAGRSAFFCLPQSLPCLGHLFAGAESMAMLGDTKERALHDRVAGTLVISTRP
ncbi:RDD family protein [Nocardiopsis oceani]